MAFPQAPPARRSPRGAALPVATALVLAAAALSPLPPAAAAGTGGTGDTLTIAMSQPIDSFNPFTAQLASSTAVLRLVYPTLTVPAAEDNTPTGELAESWRTSDDGLTWTFTIREGLTWSDGEALDAEDAAWTFTTMMEDPGAATANGNFVANFESVRAPDPGTLVIELSKPQATMLALDVPIVPEHVWSEVGDIAAFDNDRDLPVVGAGPFTLAAYEPNQSVTLDADEDFWRGAPGFDHLVLRYFTDQDAMVEALRGGEVSFVHNLTPAQAESLEGEPGITVNAADGKRFTGFTVNPGARTRDGEEFGDGHPALRDRTVRQAVMLAIDKEALVERVYGGYATVAEGYIPARYEDYHWRPADGERLGHDPERAREMLDEAGYEEGADGVRVSPDGDPLRFRMAVHNDRPDYVQTGRSMEEWLAEVGIAVEGDYIDSGQIGDRLNAGEYDLIFTGWTVNPDPDYVLGIHTCDALPEEPGSMRGDAYFCDEEYDEYYAAQLAEYDPAARADIVADMQRLLYTEAVVNVLVYADMLEAYRSDQISDIRTQPARGGNLWAQDGYWSWWSARPREAETEGGGLSPAVAVGAVAAVVLVGGLVLLLVLRRRGTEDERE
ncbi:ABC transporter substrate-binding protein [Actinorugispora endophytica]|uniref:Peptide/nickel transport system substrate-binding protein n=1 Tax=Actinorugispora endophytica TaxID=1605990 RepID=A0A4R6UY84_9ACTN|nr:ABC transporter substrate-binding protein [Actinorugispora endophytica]TDQ52444.1 peptide/nickel transport system substrate-binding protein [Actinorugispora endophytica]